MKEKLEWLIKLANKRLSEGQLLVVDCPWYEHDEGDSSNAKLVGTEIGLFYSPNGPVVKAPHSKTIIRKRFPTKNESTMYDSMFDSVIIWMLFGQTVKSDFVNIPSFRDIGK